MSRNRTVTVSVRRQRVGLVRILVHFVLTCVTGGLWLVFLLIRALLR